MAKGNIHLTFFTIEYFSRWIKVELVAKITTAAAQWFVWKNIICRYGVPNNIVNDNGTQFDSARFKALCEGLGINICFALGELAAKSLRTRADHEPADHEMSLDLLEENRVHAAGVTAAYNKKVKLHPLAPSGMVLKRVTNPATVGKMESKWEGSYIIARTARTGSYYIATLEGQQLDHMWNAKSLCRFYP